MKYTQNPVEMTVSFQSTGKNPQHSPVKAIHFHWLSNQSLPCSVGSHDSGKNIKSIVTHIPFQWLTFIADGFRISLQPNQIRHVVVTANVETNNIWKLGIWKTKQETFPPFKNTKEIKITPAFHSSLLWGPQVCRGGFAEGLTYSLKASLTALTFLLPTAKLTIAEGMHWKETGTWVSHESTRVLCPGHGVNLETEHCRPGVAQS